jgi:threonine/homoserine/homoserine lactone efflux protein
MNPHIALSLFHILAVVPFLLYVAFVRGQLDPWIFTVLQILGALILIYHSYKVMIKWKAKSLSVWVNVIHVLAVAPMLLFIGSKGYDTPRWAFEILAMLGFAALGYHLYSMVNEIKDISLFDHKATQRLREEASLDA